MQESPIYFIFFPYPQFNTILNVIYTISRLHKINWNKTSSLSE
jgi:hypothetical protein